MCVYLHVLICVHVCMRICVYCDFLKSLLRSKPSTTNSRNAESCTLNQIGNTKRVTCKNTEVTLNMVHVKHRHSGTCNQKTK